MAVPNNHPLKKLKFVSGGERWLINGCHYTILSFMGMAKDRGLSTSRNMILKRLRAGETDLEKLLAEPPRDRRAEHKARHVRKTIEMQELLDRMGPPKRY